MDRAVIGKLQTLIFVKSQPTQFAWRIRLRGKKSLRPFAASLRPLRPISNCAMVKKNPDKSCPNGFPSPVWETRLQQNEIRSEDVGLSFIVYGLWLPLHFRVSRFNKGNGEAGNQINIA